MTEVELIAEAVVERLRAERDTRPLLSPAQAAERLGVSERLVRELIAPGPGGAAPRIASFKVESARKIEAAEIDRYVAAQKARGDA